MCQPTVIKSGTRTPPGLDTKNARNENCCRLGIGFWGLREKLYKITFLIRGPQGPPAGGPPMN